MELIELNFTYDEAQYKRLIRQYMTQNRTMVLMMVISMSLMVPMIVISAIIWQYTTILLMMILFEVALVLIWCFLFWFCPHSAYKAYLKEPADIHVAFREDEVQLVSLERIVKTEWTLFSRAVETRDFFYLYFAHEEEPYIALPKAQYASAEEIEIFRQWVGNSAIKEKKLAKTRNGV